MNSLRTIAVLAGVLAIAGCSSIADIAAGALSLKYKLEATILSAEETAREVTDEMVTNTVKGAEAYCGNVREEKRLRLRAQTDLGKGPVVEGIASGSDAGP
jgi:hypothetical protein